MSTPLRRHFSPLRSVSASLTLFAFAACETERHSRRGPPTAEEGTPAPAATSAPEMAAHGNFFAGQLETEVLLSRGGFGPRSDSKEGGRDRGGDSGSRGRAGYGGGGRRKGGGGSREGGESTATRGSPGRDADPASHIVASNKPPVRLQLRLTNHGSEPVDIEVLDFNSDLGNFVVQPKKISLPPGESVEAEPMTSRLGVAADALPLIVRIRRNGQVEQQVLTLEVIAPPKTP